MSTFQRAFDSPADLLCPTLPEPTTVNAIRFIKRLRNGTCLVLVFEWPPENPLLLVDELISTRMELMEQGDRFTPQDALFIAAASGNCLVLDTARKFFGGRTPSAS